MPNPKEAAKELNKITERVRVIVRPLVIRAAADAFKEHAKDFETSFVKNRLSGNGGLKRRSGTLARSLRHYIQKEKEKVTVFVGFTGHASVYATTHEEGRTIRPTGKRKYLAIPVGKAKTKAGVSRYKSPREISGLRFMQKKGGKPFLGMLKGKRNPKVVVYFLLRKQVTIPPRLQFRQTWKEYSKTVTPRIEKHTIRLFSEKFKRTV